MPVPAPNRPPGHPSNEARSEQAFWRGVGVNWKHLAGSITREGFSFEWHDTGAGPGFDWSQSFHLGSVEICLNLVGQGWVAANGIRAEFKEEAAGFFANNGAPLAAERLPGQRHEFLSVEFDLGFLRRHLGDRVADLHPLVRNCLHSTRGTAGVSGVSSLNQRQRDLMRSLLHPPVLRSAQALWYHSKALEFAAEFFFSAAEEPLCTRAQRLAQERVNKAKAVLVEDLEVTLSLEELGRRVGCSPFYLSRTFTQETGLTNSHWLRRARLEKAAELLRTRACNVTEAALQVGYSSLSHFSQAFRETFGCCPGLYPLRTDSQRIPGLDGSSGAG